MTVDGTRAAKNDGCDTRAIRGTVLSMLLPVVRYGASVDTGKWTSYWYMKLTRSLFSRFSCSMRDGQREMERNHFHHDVAPNVFLFVLFLP